jgi:hypothetical protein
MLRPARRAISVALFLNTRAVLAPTVPTPSKPSFTGFNAELQKLLTENFQRATLRNVYPTVNKSLACISHQGAG